MTDFNPYIQIQPAQQVRDPFNLGAAQAAGQVVAPAWSLGKALQQLAPSLAEASKQKQKKEEELKMEEQTAFIQALTEQEEEAKLGELIAQRVKNGELPPGYSPYMMDLLERQSGRRAFREYRSLSDQALKQFGDPDYAGDPEEVLASIQAQVLDKYGAGQEGAKFLAEFVTLRGEYRENFKKNATLVRSDARQTQARNGFADDVQVAISEFGDDPKALQDAFASLMREAVGSSVFVGMPKGELTNIMGATMKVEVERLINQEDFEEARTLLDNFRVLNPRSGRLNGTPGDDESTDIRQPNSFAYDHGTLIATLESSLQTAEMKASERDAGKSLATANATAASVANIIGASDELTEWIGGLDPDLSNAEVQKLTKEWIRDTGFALPQVARAGLDINERVQELVLSQLNAPAQYAALRQERLEDMRGSEAFSSILGFGPEADLEFVEQVVRREATAQGVSQDDVPSLLDAVIQRRNIQKNDTLNPIEAATKKQAADKLFSEFMNTDLTGMTSEEYLLRRATYLPRFEAIGTEAAATFRARTGEELQRRAEKQEQSLRFRESNVSNYIREADEQARLALLAELQKVVEYEKAEVTAEQALDLAAFIQGQRNTYTRELERVVNAATVESLNDDLRTGRDSIEQQLDKERATFVSGLARQGGAKAKTPAAQQGVAYAQSLTELDTKSEIASYLEPLKNTGPRNLAWNAVWTNKDDAEWRAAVRSANFLIEEALSEGKLRNTKPGLIAVINGEPVQQDGEHASDGFIGWWLEAFGAVAPRHTPEEVKQAAMVAQLGETRDIYAYDRGRRIQIKDNKRLDRYGITIPDNLLDPYKVPVFPKGAFQDPQTTEFLRAYSATTDRVESERLLNEWLKADSPGARAYKLLPPKFQLDPPAIFGAQGAFFKTWTEAQ